MTKLTELCPCIYWARKFEAGKFEGEGGLLDHHPRCDGTGKSKDLILSQGDRTMIEKAREFLIQNGVESRELRWAVVLESYADQQVASAVAEERRKIAIQLVNIYNTSPLTRNARIREYIEQFWEEYGPKEEIGGTAEEMANDGK